MQPWCADSGFRLTMMESEMKQIIRALLLTGSVVMLSACTTPYQEMGALGGVAVTRIDSTSARVTAAVNGYTDRTVAANYALLKAAETTQQSGFGHFAIVSDQSDITTSTNVYYNAYTGMASAYDVEKPRNDIMIRMFPGKRPPNAPGNVYDAVDIINTLGPQVQRPSTSSKREPA